MGRKDRLEKFLWKRIPKRWILFRKKRMEQYVAATGVQIQEQLQSRILSEVKAGIVLIILFIVCFTVGVITNFIQADMAVIQRNSTGEGESEETVRIKIRDETFEYRLPVSEKKLTKEEETTVFEEGFQYLEKEMLNKNKSMDEIRSHLNLLWEIPNSPLEVKWESEDESVVDLEGKVKNHNLKKGSKVTHLKLILSYQNAEKEKVYSLTIYPRSISENQAKAEAVLEEIKNRERKDRTASDLQIPLKINGATIQLGDKKNAWMLLAGFLLLAGVLLAARQWENEKKKKDDVRKASELEYSNILWQFVLLLEAGFTIRTAWDKILSDYEKRKDQMREERRFVYEQMSYAYHQMELGSSMEQMFQTFSGKMQLPVYSKLMTLFLQNITKGSRNMLQILKTEERQAFTDRCEQAKRMGEEADTKLLFPMGIMLLNILLLLMVPAYLQF